MNDLVSIIVPIYNVEKYLKRCVISLINQTYKNIEIILVDDGSTDNSRLMCDELKELDKRIRVIHKKNGGLSDARNVGINNAKGKYYSFIDSDDYITIDTIENLYKSMMKYDCDISICNMVQFNDNNEIFSFYEPTNQLTIYNDNDRFKTLNQPSVCNKLFKSLLFQNIQFPIGKYYEDTYIYHELLYKAKKVVLTGKTGYWYYMREGSILGQPTFTNKYFDFVEAVYLRSMFLFEHDIQPYANEAFLSFYVAMSNVYKHIDMNTQNIALYQLNKKRYSDIYNVIRKDKKISIKQRLRLFLLRYFPNVHSILY